MKHWTSIIRHVLARAMRPNARLFEVEDHRRDGALVVRPTRDIWGVGQRLVCAGVLPEEYPGDQIDLLFEVERQDDPIWEVRYLHLRWRTGRRFAPRDAKLAIGWPISNTDILLAVLKRALREMLDAARAERALAESDGRGLVEGSQQPVPGNGGQR